jgi:hypothetical protein
MVSAVPFEMCRIGFSEDAAGEGLSSEAGLRLGLGVAQPPTRAQSRAIAADASSRMDGARSTWHPPSMSALKTRTVIGEGQPSVACISPAIRKLGGNRGRAPTPLVTPTRTAVATDPD